MRCSRKWSLDVEQMYLQGNRKAKPIRKCKYSPSSAGMIRAKAAQPSTVQKYRFFRRLCPQKAKKRT